MKTFLFLFFFTLIFLQDFVKIGIFFGNYNYNDLPH